MSSRLTRKITSIVVSVTTIVTLSGAGVFVPLSASAETTAEAIARIRAQIDELVKALAALEGTGGGTTTACSFTRSLTVGSTGEDVKCLQQYLNSAGYPVASSGAGSPGSETTYFGSRTKTAVAAWQAASGVTPSVGYFGPISQAKYTSLATTGTGGTGGTGDTGTGGTGGTGGTTAPGTGLTVSLSSDQPVSGLFGENFASRSFTNIALTAGTDGDVTVKSMTVKRTGAGNDAAFSGVILLDSDGTRIGDSKTFGSDHTLKLTPNLVVKAGQSKAVTLAGDSDADQNDYNGQIVSLTLMAADAGSATVSGIPTDGFTGTAHTVNSTLSIGTVTLTRGALDPGSGVTKEVGTTGYTFAGLQLTAGSNEDVIVKSVQWNQSGSAASTDLANVIVTFADKDYPATANSDGKYYTAVFGEGITLAKGSNKEMAIKGDVVSGSNRGVDFDLYRAADIKAVGASFGYGITPTYTNSSDSATDDDGTLQNANPNYDAYETTIGAGSMTIETAASDVPAQNIGVAVSEQPLGGWKVTVKGEPITVAQTIFRLSRWYGTSATANTQDITGITIIDQNGNNLAGPADITASAAAVTFSETITYPVGTTILKLRGKAGTDYASNDTIAASTTPNSDWTTVKGVNTNQTITLSSATFTGSTMTVKAGTLRVSTSPTPIAQTIVAGASQFNFANFTFDTTASGEDIRLNSVQVEFNFGEAASNDDLTNCQLWDTKGTSATTDDVALNTGTNAVNGGNSDATAVDTTFNFDKSWIMPKATIQTLALKCNTSATTTTTIADYNWTMEIPGDADDMVPTGATSGSTVTETYDDTTGQAITLTNAGSLAVAKGSLTSNATSTWNLASAGTTNNLINDLVFRATNEDIRVDQVGVKLSGTSSNTPQDLAKITLWDGSTKIGETVLTSDYATVTLAGFTVPKDNEKTVTVKVDIAQIGTSEAARPGHHIMVDYAPGSADSAGNTTRGVGMFSGSALYATPAQSSGTWTDSAGGLVIFKSVPTVTKHTVTSNKIVDGTRQLYRFKISAPSTGNGAGLYQFVYKISTTTQGRTDYIINNMQVVGYNDDCTTAAYDNSGRLNSSTMGVTAVDSARDGNAATPKMYRFRFDPVAQDGTAAAIQVPAGQTRCFELKGTVNNSSATSSTLTVQLMGDLLHQPISFDTGDTWTAFNYAFATSAAQVASSSLNVCGWDCNLTANGAATSSFVWSGNSTTTSRVGHNDWTNGFRLFNGAGLDTETFSP